jgi:hypothetical protein
LAVRELDDGILLLDMAADKIHQLNETAAFIWKQCDGVSLAEGIASSLAREFGVEEGVAQRDVERTLSKLRTLNLVVEA